MSSIHHLVELSDEPRLRQHVTGIRLEVELIHENLREEEWRNKVQAYGTRTVESDSSDDWSGKPKHDALLAQERDSLSVEEIAKCWKRLQVGMTEQEELQKHSMSSLMDMLTPAFAQLPALRFFTCNAMSLSKHVTESNKLRRLQGETLTYPPLTKDPRPGDVLFITTYATACLASLLDVRPEISSVSMAMFPWNVLVKLSNYWQSSSKSPDLSNLTSMRLYTICREPFTDTTQAEGMEAITTMLSTAPDLIQFNWGHGPECMGPEIDDYVNLQIPNFFDFDEPCLLASLDLGGVSCEFDELYELLDRVSGSLESLDLGSMSLNGGYGFDMFNHMHDSMDLFHFGIRGRLEDWDGVRGRAWDPGSIQDYVIWVNEREPLQSSDEGGSPGVWMIMSDSSLRYDSVYS
ncbi:uncharacterized protein HMPREF1541_02604 [Cyphellophora europaea CBS 101466]|uniref:Uncharacterized protein n=1 Tax=Cyphellophora europaea (strain CBS 101466) TaxID=1220924 RepID=W2S4D6_CYPE1|nr:uncharacterized protein HMPREF1541_02604 [Cyphellophora europaea CBS 101466]ETN43445.1 hypothetical protein HMPREF1541_02604 [Cyphellophora europaea CBS 101466]